MKKTDFISHIATKLNVSKKESENIYETVFGSMVDTIKENEMFKVTGLGTFTIIMRAARKGINLQTGKPLLIPAKKVLKFKVSKKLKDEIAGKK